MTQPLLEISELGLRFAGRYAMARILSGVNLTVDRGEAVAVVGESGSGKSMTALAVMGLARRMHGAELTGSIAFDGHETMDMSDAELRMIRGCRIGMIFQDPMTSLNPVLTIGRQLTEHLQYHLDLPRRHCRERAIDLLRLVGIVDPATRVDDYPHQFSGGMRQRVMIAMAIACEPDLLIADEPTTALDVTVQAEIISLVMRIKGELGTSLLWITHDLASIAGLADRIAIMYAGRVVEIAPVDAIFDKAAHPYARDLLAAAPDLTPRRAKRLVSIKGYPPGPTENIAGCAFASRCSDAIERCHKEMPTFEEVGPERFAACFRAEELVNMKGKPVTKSE